MHKSNHKRIKAHARSQRIIREHNIRRNNISNKVKAERLQRVAEILSPKGWKYVEGEGVVLTDETKENIAQNEVTDEELVDQVIVEKESIDE